MCWSGFLTINLKRAHLDTTQILTFPENWESGIPILQNDSHKDIF